MATRGVNVKLGQVLKDGKHSMSSAPASVAAGDVSLTWDDTKITTRAQLRAAVQEIMLTVEGTSFLT